MAGFLARHPFVRLVAEFRQAHPDRMDANRQAHVIDWGEDLPAFFAQAAQRGEAMLFHLQF